MLHRLKRLLIGSPRPTRRLRETELPKRLALPVFSADPLSSVAYATEQAMIALFAVSIAGRGLVMPIAAAIAAVLAITVLSYQQTVRVYSTSGGAYAVAKDNLGTLVALTAAAALMVDYVLTVAVSVSAGVTTEPVTGRRLHSSLQNTRALYLKWLLLFEPRVALASVPYRCTLPTVEHRVGDVRGRHGR